jgi:hypothetical protein
VFSSDDINAFVNYIHFDKNANNNFTLEVTTSAGSYILIIDDLDKVNSFYSSNLSNTTDLGLFNAQYNLLVKSSFSDSTNELGLLKFLNILDSGISVLKSNNDYPNLNKLTYDSNSQSISNTPCN